MHTLQLAQTDRTQRGLSQFSRKDDIRQSHRIDAAISSLAKSHVHPTVGGHPTNREGGTGDAKKASGEVGTVESARPRMLNDFSRMKSEIGYRLGRITLLIPDRRVVGRDREENRDLQPPAIGQQFSQRLDAGKHVRRVLLVPFGNQALRKIIKQDHAALPLNRKIHHGYCSRFKQKSFATEFWLSLRNPFEFGSQTKTLG